MGLREIMPAMMLRSYLDQECYDFVKWWASRDLDSEYDWGDMALPHLDIRGAGVFEEPEFFSQYLALNHAFDVLLLKLKLLVDIRNLKIVRKILILRRLPFDLGELIEPVIVRSPLSTRLQKQSPVSLFKPGRALLGHVRMLSETLRQTNRYFIFRLFDPDQALAENISILPLRKPRTWVSGCHGGIGEALRERR
ncbi:hypothetical protein BGZ61DRAFT_527566 [Ilyonectria robusta]|uniref:uncharacterized protein n=1 Tax=Ilyonectria robusta TaxID=1079257 RepID=UPI001E8EF382|nr:uncharacterized protein BGZ61DRAFT_527566 [Ilyonectria robusta]KAH8736635.1 hypothetical protein BGZ61DRAFT_527566 [Ilyonectria robusta]